MEYIVSDRLKFLFFVLFLLLCGVPYYSYCVCGIRGTLVKIRHDDSNIARRRGGGDRGAVWRDPAKFEPRPRRSDVARKRASERAERANALLLLPLLLRANCVYVQRHFLCPRVN